MMFYLWEMSQHQDNKNNWVVADEKGRIVEGPSSKEEAEKKCQLSERQGDQTQPLSVKQLLTE